jgi:hypothetical protein
LQIEKRVAKRIVNRFDYFNYFDYSNYSNYCDYFQVHRDLGIADHVWEDKHTAIARNIYHLGYLFRQTMRTGWPAYITKTYHWQKEAVCVDPVLGQDVLVVPYDDA